ncbi:hypothetical protein [Nocardia yamanashiensis]|uniref:hypothetical protein n=1 Tax=Nocardia yamanashiensis TaxID=209247 RepID=UPI00082DD8D0|nr:hypothetical protein [Nocardia yamanashiensis]
MPLSFDTAGLRQVDTDRWISPDTGDMFHLQYHDMVPDLPAPLEQLDTLRRRLAELHAQNGCLIEAFVIGVDAQPALLRLEKLPHPQLPRGQIFAASIVVPKDRCSLSLAILCPEAGVTGMREAMLGAQLGFDNFYPPHPYAPEVQSKLPFHIADDIRYDQQFPEHPLTRARQLVARLVPGMRLDPNFAGLPSFQPR